MRPSQSSTEPDELCFTTVVELARRIAHKELSPVEVIETYLARIDDVNPTLNAFVYVAHDIARAEARKSEERTIHGDARPLEGVPIAIKDDTVVAGMPTSEGTAMVPSSLSDKDAYLVGELRAAGAIVLGKTNLPECGTKPVTENMRWGDTKNPWDLTRTPGGSSGGSAAAVASGMAPAGHGCDGGGSLRIPASCCGLFTVKPTRGRISTAPYSSDSLLNVHGYLTRSVVDNAVLLDITRGNVLGDAHWAPEPRQPYVDEVHDALTGPRMKIAWTATPPMDVPVHSACVEAVHEAAKRCARLGHVVEEMTPDWQNPSAQEDFMDMWSAIIGWGVEYLAEHGGNLEAADPYNRALYERGRALPATTYLNVVARLRQSVRTMMVVWDTYDLVLTPTLAQPPVPIGWMFKQSDDPESAMDRTFLFNPFLPMANVSGQPAASIPLCWHNGLPIGVQAIARQGDEASLFRLSAELEHAMPWGNLRPRYPVDSA